MAGWVGGITGGSGVNSKSGADQEKTEPHTFLLQVGRQNEGPPGLALEDPPLLPKAALLNRPQIPDKTSAMHLLAPKPASAARIKFVRNYPQTEE